MKEYFSNNKEIITFIIFLILIVFIVIYHKIYDILGIESTITFFAVFVALGTSILTFFYNKKVLQQAKELNERTLDHAKELNEEALLQSEKNLHIQLLFEESRRSLYELKKFLEYKDFDMDMLKKFINSYHAIYLPNNTKTTLNDLIKEVDEFNKTAPWYRDYQKEYDEHKLSPEEEKSLLMESKIEEEFLNKNPILKFESDYEKKSNSIRNMLMKNVLENLEKDPSDL